MRAVAVAVDGAVAVQSAAAQRLAAAMTAADPANAASPADGRDQALVARELAGALHRADLHCRAAGWLCTHLYRLGLFADVVREAQMILSAMAGAELTLERCELTRVLVISACELGEFGVALAAAQQLATSAVDEASEDVLTLHAAFAMAVCLERLGDSWQASRVLTSALEQTAGAAPGLPRMMALSLLGAIQIGAYHRLAGLGPDMQADETLQRGRVAVSEASALLGIVADPVYAVTVTANLGEVLIYQGDIERSMVLLQCAHDQARALGLLAHMWRIEASIGAWLLTTHQPELALTRMQRLISEMGDAAPQSTAIRTHDVAYKACRATARPEQALAHFEVVERLQRRIAVVQLRAQSQLFVTRVEVQQAQSQAQKARLDAQVQREKAAESADHAERDPLTGLGNRRHFDRRCAELLPLLQREGRPLALVLLDIDHFKAVNDTHGHAAGDRVLVRLTQLLKDNTRSNDVLVRHGGEEFVVMLPGMALEQAGEVCERLRRCVAENAAFGSNGTDLPVTISLGLATTPDYDAATLLHRADTALYRAKHHGRNRVCVDAGSM